MQDATKPASGHTLTLFTQVKELKSSQNWDECFPLLEEIWSTIGGQQDENFTFDGSEKDSQFQLGLLQTWAETLEGYIEHVGVVLSLEEEELQRAIFSAYKKLAQVHQRRSCLLMSIWEKEKKLQSDEEEDDTDLLIESLLDWSISSKRARDYTNCVKAFWLMMKVDPSSKSTNVIRLLGGSTEFYANVCSRLSLDANLERPTILPVESNDSSQDFQPDERWFHGIFDNVPFYNLGYGPSVEVLKLGSQVRQLFDSHAYTLTNILSMLRPVLESTLPAEMSRDRPAILNATTLFELRHEYLHCRQKVIDETTPFICLVELFILGLAMEAEQVQTVLGNGAVNLLAEAGVLHRIPTSPSDSRLVGAVMVYPISPSDLAFGDPQFSESGSCLFVTDWPVESLLLPEFAVMSIGDDTLELLGLVVGAAKKNKELGGHDTCFPILDMCCGCGVQGIFVWYCSKELVLKPGDESLTTGISCGVDDMLSWLCSKDLSTGSVSALLTMVDINLRAIQFATANLALNGFPVHNDDSYATVRVVHDNLLNSFDEHQSHIKFKTVVSNPPFVPDPAMRSTYPFQALPKFAVGGGSDGMAVLRRFLSTCFPYLDTTFNVYIVTEVPNVEHSCEMLLTFVPPDFRSSIHIRVAYVVEDVETIEEYTKNRETEAGTTVSARDWLTNWKDGGNSNRALVLISITKLPDGRETKLGLYPYASGQSADNGPGYDEDAFLVAKGVKYVRDHLL